MICKDCGEIMVGDGYTSPIHCPELDADGLEPDANPLYCGGIWASLVPPGMSRASVVVYAIEAYFSEFGICVGLDYHTNWKDFVGFDSSGGDIRMWFKAAATEDIRDAVTSKVSELCSAVNTGSPVGWHPREVE